MGYPPRIPVLLGLDKPVIYFITLCVQHRQTVLANEAAFDAFKEVAATISWKILAAILMPDHMHLLATPYDREASVGSVSATIKRRMRRRLGAEWEWQPGCFDRLLRREEFAEAKWQYIRENPVRAGLVAHWDDWPYRFGFADL